MTKKSKIALMLGGLLIVAVLLFIFLERDEEKITVEKPKEVLDEQDVLDQLPLTKTVYERDNDLEIITYRLMFDLMDVFKRNGKLESVGFTRFHVLEGDEHEFEVAVVFGVMLGDNVQDTTWGIMNENRYVDDLVWKLKIKQIEGRTYSLEGIEKLSDTMIGLPPVQDLESFKEEVGLKEPSEQYRYQIIENTLQVTYDNGLTWVDVPVAVEELFEGDYNGTTNYLIDGSYVISPERTAFVVGGSRDFHLLISTDQGNSWDEVLITTQIEGARMRLLGFTSDQNGYFITTGYRTMRSEGNFIYTTNDGGKTWNRVGSVGVSSMVTDGAFINEDLGFVSFGTVQIMDEAPKPRLYRTDSGGHSWEEVDVPIPEEYKGYFTEAEIPIFNGEKGTLLVNQGPTGDYLGGNVLAKYTSDDMGKTWTFAGLVDPDHVLIK